MSLDTIATLASQWNLLSSSLLSRSDRSSYSSVAYGAQKVGETVLLRVMLRRSWPANSDGDRVLQHVGSPDDWGLVESSETCFDCNASASINSSPTSGNRHVGYE